MSENYKYTYFIWISLIGILLLLTLFKVPGEDYNAIGVLTVVVHALFTAGLLMAISSRYSMIFVGALLARFLVMLWDLYASSIFILPNSGADTEFYYNWAVMVSENFDYLSESIRGGLYSKILGVLFYFTGPMRIMAQYINVLLGLSTVLVIFKILLLLKINNKSTRTVLLIAAFFPNSLIMSAILLREILPTFFVAVSLLYFVKWYNGNKIISFILSIVWIGIASMFHSGVVAIVFGYLLMFLFYNHRARKFDISFRNILLFLPVLAFIFLFTTQFGDFIFYKFRSLEEPTDIYESVKLARGESAYLTDFTVTSPAQFFIYSPVRAFYFLFSPLPMNWRGFMDVITFLLDSFFYFYVLYYAFVNYSRFRQNKKLIIILLLIVVSVAFIFGIGVSNAGTAMRHRQKIVPVFLLLLAVMKNEKVLDIIRLKGVKLERLRNLLIHK